VAVNLKDRFSYAAGPFPACGTAADHQSLFGACRSTHYPNMAAYSMGKAAINHFTLILAAELASVGSTVNCIAPG